MKETAVFSKNARGKKSCLYPYIVCKKDLYTSKVLLLASDQRVISGFQIRQVDLEQPIDHL